MSTPRSAPPIGWWTAQTAASFLQVKRATLYTYASRGWVQTRKEGGRHRLYREADVRSLRAKADEHRGGAPAAARALDWGAPVLSTAISYIDRDGPYYRGVAALTFVEQGVTLEGVADWLWRTEAPWQPQTTAFKAVASTVAVDPVSDVLLSLAALLPQLAAADASRAVPHPTEAPRGRRVLIEVVAHLAHVAAGHGDGLASALCAAHGLDQSAVPAVNAALVLCADHELNASTFAVRICASAGADLYACISAGLATLSGARHGGVVRRVQRMVASARSLGDRLADGEPIVGLGHPLYPHGDPRGAALLELAQRRASTPHREEFAHLLALVREAKDLDLPSINLDFGLVALAVALGAPPEAPVTWFAVGRVVGWIAHVVEQREQGVLLRPRAQYIGG